jgi:hypothetical protein
MKIQRMGGKTERVVQIKGQNTAWPEDARPNPYLTESFDNLNDRMSCAKKIEAHSRGVGGMALHAKK